MTLLELLPLVGAIFTLLLLLKHTSFSSTKKRLPPGPRGYPLIGNLLDIPRTVQPDVYHEWSRRYRSDVIYVNVLGTSMIVIDSCKAAQELLEKRSAIYASRPAMIMVNELSGFSSNAAFMPYGEQWKSARKLLHRYFETARRTEYRHAQIEATLFLLHSLLDDPRNFLDHLRAQSTRFIIAIVYGHKVNDRADIHVELSKKWSSASAKISYGYLVDFLPLLRYIPVWLPGAGFKRLAKASRRYVQDMIDVPFYMAKGKIEKGESPEELNNIVSDLFSRPGENNDEVSQKGFLASVYAAGAGTTSAALSTFFLAMVLYPDAQRRGQEAVDKVLRHRRLPDFSDLGTIPYIDALVKETIRWRPVVPLNLPHLSVSDDIYGDYYIPAGTTVWTNIWAMLQDKETYGPNTEDFHPERFLREELLDGNIRDPSEAFGFGRRACPGMMTAKEMIWMSIASVLAVFDIEMATAEDGRPIRPSSAYPPGFSSRPAPFECVIKPRSPEIVALLRAAQYETGY